MDEQVEYVKMRLAQLTAMHEHRANLMNVNDILKKENKKLTCDNEVLKQENIKLRSEIDRLKDEVTNEYNKHWFWRKPYFPG